MEKAGLFRPFIRRAEKKKAEQKEYEGKNISRLHMACLHNRPGGEETLGGVYKNTMRLYFHSNISCSNEQNCGKIVNTLI